MNAKEFFELHKGKELTINGAKCVVCGYSESEDTEYYELIVAFTEKPIESWKFLGGYDNIITHNNNPYGYWYVDESDLNS